MKLPHHQIGRIDFVYNSFLFLVDVFGADKDAKRMDDKVPIISIITTRVYTPSILIKRQMNY